MPELLQLLNDHYTKHGFKIFLGTAIPQFGWGFDFFAQNKTEKIGIEIRKDSKIPPPLFFERFNAIKKSGKSLFVYVAFEKMPDASVLSRLKNEGIGVITLDEGHLLFLFRPELLSKKLKGKKKAIKIKSMEQMFVYPSSRQRQDPNNPRILPERAIICKLVKEFCDMGIPVCANLVEEDPNGGPQFKKKMRGKMNESHIFIGVLKGPYSKNVEYEFRYAIPKKDKALIHILKHESKKKDEIWTNDPKQEKLVKYVERMKIVHIPYYSLADFKNKVRKQLQTMIRLLYKQKKCHFPLDP